MPDRDTIIGWLLIVGIIAAILFARQRGKARFAASMASAAADARASLVAELNAMSSSAANVQVHTNVGQGVGDSGIGSAAYESAVLRVVRAELAHARELVALDSVGSSSGNHGSAYDDASSDDDLDVARALEHVARNGAGRTVPVDRFVSGRDRIRSFGHVETVARPMNGEEPF